MKKAAGFQIQAEERQSWGSIAMVWIGSVICVPALMIGGMLGAGLSLGNCVLAILVGYALICMFMIFMGMLGCDTGPAHFGSRVLRAGGKGGQVHHQYDPCHLLHRLVRHPGRRVRGVFLLHVRGHDRHRGASVAGLGGVGRYHATDRLLPFRRAEMAQ